jgi:hypothetical protein
MTVPVLNQSWPVSDEYWGPVPPRAQAALERLFEKSAFRKLLEGPAVTPTPSGESE